MSTSYIIHGGDAGVRRLEFLARATWPGSQLFLEEAGLKSNMRVLEVGCGGGTITRLLMEEFQLSQIVAVDFDETAIQIAKNSKLKADFLHLDITQSSLKDLGTFDFIYCRFVLSHLKSPSEALAKLKSILNPKGIIAVEDTYFDGHFSIPKNPAFDRYVELFKQSAQKRGAHPNIGPELPNLLREAGLFGVDLRVSSPAFIKGDGKQIANLTLRAIREASLKEIPESEFAAVEADLKKFTDDDSSILSLARIFQCWGLA